MYDTEEEDGVDVWKIRGAIEVRGGTLFWYLKPETQARLLQWQFDNYGEKLDIPTPPMTSKGVWLTVEMESAEEIDRLIRQPPSRSHEWHTIKIWLVPEPVV